MPRRNRNVTKRKTSYPETSYYSEKAFKKMTKEILKSNKSSISADCSKESEAAQKNRD